MTSCPFPASESPAIDTPGPGESFGSKAALEGGDLMVPRAVEAGPLQKGPLMRVSSFLRGLSRRLFSVAVVIARHVTEIFQNSTPSL